MKKKKFVLLLDDIWRKVELQEIGVPFPTREKGCKVVFTTRSREVCGHMGVDDPIEVKCLASDEAWDLFRIKVGKITLESHPDILELACKVAKKCRGLPLALNIIGETMACQRTVQEWRHAVDVLTSSGAEFPDEKEGREKAFNQGYKIIGTLVRACLLLEVRWTKCKSYVTMHDVVREMALWILSDLGKHKEICIVKAGVGLREVPEVKEWAAVRRMSLMQNKLGKLCGSPNCPQVTTLLLQENYTLNISEEFFSFMRGLLVLDLSYNGGFTVLPEQISKLVSLRYLDLSYTDIERLPGSLRELKKLIHLNLEDTRELESMSGISDLPSLRTLRLRSSKVLIDLSLMKELERLDYLDFVTIKITSSAVAEMLLSFHRLLECIKEVRIQYLQEELVRVLNLAAMVNLQRLNIDSGMEDIKIERITSTFFNKGPIAPYLLNLSSVFIRGCNGIKDLTWLLFAPNLTLLEVNNSNQLRDIICKEKYVGSVMEDEVRIIVPFPKLENLYLSELPMLKSIYSSPLPFPCLRKISISGCPKLRKLPLDSKSVVRVEELDIHWIPLSLRPPRIRMIQVRENFIRLVRKPLDSSSGAADEETVIYYQDKEWMEGFEWEDEATRLRFLPSCKLGT
ncbi:unnamed protein product [Microthlaspi erraticum]|uniref:Uncharacterized protein n=1 Tax=Microthlaspi erraticum TaxID=1685480 RepID=A0A6D2I364_9BRAS|nr:unnamed protein product [Microthlaspi erraticum]CAA7054383.1 unnamed protein product [Microthlaspi erraticum]